MANTITLIRILCSLILLFCPMNWFYFFYLVAGISDGLDGWIARKTHTESEYGAKLDSIADFCLLVVCCIRLIPILSFPTWIYFWILCIGICKGKHMLHQFGEYNHHRLNKIMGFLLYIFPFTISIINPVYCAIGLCLVATMILIIEKYSLFCR
ncbi:CDP-alcohol phosphatidyltransferase family protein [Floccifex sp.]|uniref:CDP-alcohol phosphatidyltransferase family protein n=1 Tax=Floccifex sp. TaxID=2815810 RepID=UPI003F016FAC